MTKNENNKAEPGTQSRADLKTQDTLLQSISGIFPSILLEYDIQKDRFTVQGGSLIATLGYTLEDLQIDEGKLLPLVESTNRAFFKGEFLKSIRLKDGQTHSFQIRFLDIDGQSRPFTTTILVNRRDQSGIATSLVGFALPKENDLSNKGLQDNVELESKLEKLTRINAELEEFTFVAAHDLQEPLRKLMTFGQRLRTGSENQLDSENANYLNRMIKAADNMKKLIDGLLDYSRISKRKEKFVSTELQDIFRQVLLEHESVVAEKKATIKIGALPKLEAIPAQMKQLFHHLIENALKFTRTENIPQIEINSAKLLKSELKTLAMDAKIPYWKISIRDNGIGFEDKYTDRIFQLLQRLHGKAEYPGSGIGLAICQKIVEVHRGIITAQGKPGEGSVFSIILPELQNS